MGQLRFEVREAGSNPVPSRLTFLQEGVDVIFDRTDGAPNELAVRKNIVYTKSGQGVLELSPGTYRVLASRGIEWSLAETELEIREGEESAWTAEIVHELDTTGWISGDFHLHTLTYSGHGDANLEERIISLMGEGVEFAVATDHNHNTDYDPTIAKLGATSELKAVTGNEISVPVGHFNAFPLDAERPVLASDYRDANALFARIRRETSSHGVVPIIQLNHPRWEGIDYFQQAGLDPVTGTSASPNYSDDFDCIEILNENVGWGYYEPVVDGVETSGNLHSVLQDWFNLLNRGLRAAAVGNSDSHTVHYAFAGYPRNFVDLGVDEPSDIEPKAVAEAIRNKRVYTTIGPFVDFSIGGVPMGGSVQADNGHVDLAIRIQAASWIGCDRVKIVVNGDVHEIIEVPESHEPLRLDTTHRLCLVDHCLEHEKNVEQIQRSLPDKDEKKPLVLPAETSEIEWLSRKFARDAWVVLLVEGDDSLAPIVPSSKRPVVPLAITNPVWIDANADGLWTALAEHRSPEIHLMGETPPPAQVAATLRHGPTRARLTEGFASTSRKVRLAAARALEQAPETDMGPLLERSLVTALEPESFAADPYFAAALARAYLASEDLDFGNLLSLPGSMALLKNSVCAGELEPFLPQAGLDQWSVLGPVPAPEPGTVSRLEVGPETDGDGERSFVHAGKDLIWKALETREGDAYLDFNALGDAHELENAMVYAQTFLHVEKQKTVPCFLGTDDGCRVYLNGRVIYDNPARKGANPFEHLTQLSLKAGWNRLLFKVENGVGGFGLYCRVLDDGVRNARHPDR